MRPVSTTVSHFRVNDGTLFLFHVLSFPRDGAVLCHFGSAPSVRAALPSIRKPPEPGGVSKLRDITHSRSCVPTRHQGASQSPPGEMGDAPAGTPPPLTWSQRNSGT